MNLSTVKFSRLASGFTLIEMLIVVAIIGILSVVAVPQYTQYRARSRDTGAVADAGVFKMAAESVFIRFGGDATAWTKVTDEGQNNAANLAADGFRSSQLQGRYVRIELAAKAAPLNYQAIFYHPTGGRSLTVTSLPGITESAGAGVTNRHCHPSADQTTCTWCDTAAH